MSNLAPALLIVGFVILVYLISKAANEILDFIERLVWKNRKYELPEIAINTLKRSRDNENYLKSFRGRK